MPKNIVVFSDGTGQEGGEGPDTNIYKLFKIIENRTPRQISFYDAGLGTGWRKISGNVGGAGITKKHLPVNGDVNGYMHNSRGEGWTRLYQRKQRSWEAKRTDKPVVHESVLQRTKNVDNNDHPPYKPWILELDYEVEKQ